MSDYPRDMTGYGRKAPDPAWPGGARICVQFVVNYEEGGESNILHGDPHSEAYLSDVVNATNWPGQRHWNMESMYEYGARAGFWRLWRLFTSRQIPVTVFGVTHALMRGREQVAGMKEAGWEIASHGLKWIEYKDVSLEREREYMRQSIALHEEVTGSPPLGFYLGRASMNTLDLVIEQKCFLYAADSYADDLPYWLRRPAGTQLVVPYTLDTNDMRFVSPQGFNSGEQFFTYLKDAFDVLYREGEEGQPKMLSIGLHCRVVGRPGRSAALERFADYVRSRPGVWIARRVDIARHWRERHPLNPADEPRA